MAKYSDVQFLGYAIPTIPLDTGDIGDPDGPGFVEGRYFGLDDPGQDIEARIDLIMTAVKKAMSDSLIIRDSSTLKIFVVPEFSLRGTQGSYNNQPPYIDYFVNFRTQFAKRVQDPTYEDWLFVIGTIITTVDNFTPGGDAEVDLKAKVREQLAIAMANAWQFANQHKESGLKDTVFNMLDTYTKYCHSDPIYKVRNRCYIAKGGVSDSTYPDGLSVEKKYISNEDFILNIYSNVFAEEAVSYPEVGDKDGEDKQSPFDDLAVFSIDGINFGIEICLDHSRSRLRKHLSQDKPIQIQIIPSCGMQIKQKSVVATTNGLVFNCDGQYGIYMPDTKPDIDHSFWVAATNGKSHTQLTQVETPCSGADPAVNSAVVKQPDGVRFNVVPVTSEDVNKIFAYGSGEVHIYTKIPIPVI